MQEPETRPSTHRDQYVLVLTHKTINIRKNRFSLCRFYYEEFNWSIEIDFECSLRCKSTRRVLIQSSVSFIFLRLFAQNKVQLLNEFYKLLSNIDLVICLFTQSKTFCYICVDRLKSVKVNMRQPSGNYQQRTFAEVRRSSAGVPASLSTNPGIADKLPGLCSTV